jgi:uncharacterized membrane protein
MKKTSSELKCMAKGLLAGHYGLLIGAALLYGGGSLVITMILELVFQADHSFNILYFICSLIVSLLSTIFTIGYEKMILEISRGREARLGDLLYGFSHQPDRIILLTILLSLVSLACMLPGSLLLAAGAIMKLIPLTLVGILALLAGTVFLFILSFGYSMVFLLYLDNPEKGVIQLMRESRTLMKGNKGRYFYLQISFIGLMLLSILTCFIGLFWLVPYMEMTSVLFYRNLLNEV